MENSFQTLSLSSNVSLKLLANFISRRKANTEFLTISKIQVSCMLAQKNIIQNSRKKKTQFPPVELQSSDMARLFPPSPGLKISAVRTKTFSKEKKQRPRAVFGSCLISSCSSSHPCKSFFSSSFFTCYDIIFYMNILLELTHMGVLDFPPFVRAQ